MHRFRSLHISTALGIALVLSLAACGQSFTAQMLSIPANSPTAGAVIQAIRILSFNNGWAVGGAYVMSQPDANGLVTIEPTVGALLHFDGAQWNLSKYQHPLLDLVMPSASSGWAVGYFGSILSFDGSAWSPQTSGVTVTLRSVAAVSASEAWAVGDNGTVLHYSNGSWQQVTVPVTTQLRAVRMVSASEGWAAGANGTVLHYTHGAWQQVTTQATFTLNAIAIAAPDDVWFGGGDMVDNSFSSASPALLHYQDGTWTTVNGFLGPISSLAAAAPNDIWAVGASGESHFDGKQWDNLQDIRTHGTLFTAYLNATSGDVFDGTLFVGITPGSMFSYARGKFTLLYQAPQCHGMVTFNC